MKRIGKSILALVLAYAMIIGNVGSGTFTNIALAAENDVFADFDVVDDSVEVSTEAEDLYATEAVYAGDFFAADEVAAVETAPAEDDIFTAAVEEPAAVVAVEDDAFSAPVAVATEDEGIFAADEKVKNSIVLDEADSKKPFDPEAKELTFDLTKATVTLEGLEKDEKLADDKYTVKVEKVQYVGDYEFVIAKDTELAAKDKDGKDKENKVKLTEDVKVKYSIVAADQTIVDGLKIGDVKGGKTISNARLAKAVKSNVEGITWTFELVSGTEAGTYDKEKGFTAKTVASTTQIGIKATASAKNVGGSDAADYAETSGFITFNVVATTAQNLRFRKEADFVDGIYEVQNLGANATYDLSVVSDDKSAAKTYTIDGDAAVIDSNGILTPNKAGYAVVTAKSVGSGSYGTETASVLVKVSNQINWLQPKYNNVTLLVGGSASIPVTIEAVDGKTATTTESLLVSTAVSGTQSVVTVPGSVDVTATASATQIDITAGSKAGFSIVSVKADDAKGVETDILVQVVTDANKIVDISKADPEALKDLANYTGDIYSLAFNTDGTPKLWVGGYESSYTYTGAKIKPEPNVYEGLTKLTKKKDYTVSYGKNTTVAQGGTIKVKFKGNYKGKAQTVSFKIEPLDISDATKVAIGDVGTTQKKLNKGKANPVVLILESGKAINKYTSKTGLSRNVTVATAATASATQAGEATIVVTGSGNFKGTATVHGYAVTKSTNIAKKTFRVEKPIYTGKAIGVSGNKVADSILVTGNGGISYDKDFEVIGVGNNVKVGKATFLVRGIGTYRGTKKVTFKIKKGKAITETTSAGTIKLIFANGNVPVSATQASPLQTVSGTGNFGLVAVPGKTASDTQYVPVEYQDNTLYYAKTGAKANYYVYDTTNGKRLMEGVDYKLSYKKKAIKKLSAGGVDTVLIKGNGAYKGSKKNKSETAKQNVIVAVPMSNVVAGAPKAKKAVAYSKIDGSKLGKKDFTYSNGTFTGSGNFTGTITVKEGNLGKIKIGAAPYTGKPVTNIDIKKGPAASAISDFANNVKVGKKAVVSFNAAGGSAAVTFKISKVNAADKFNGGVATDGTATK